MRVCDAPIKYTKNPEHAEFTKIRESWLSKRQRNVDFYFPTSCATKIRMCQLNYQQISQTKQLLVTPQQRRQARCYIPCRTGPQCTHQRQDICWFNHYDILAEQSPVKRTLLSTSNPCTATTVESHHSDAPPQQSSTTQCWFRHDVASQEFENNW